MRAPRRCRSLNNGNQAGGGTVHYGALSWRMHEDDFRVRTQDHRALRRLGDPARFLAGRLAAELCRARAVLRPGRIRARRVGQGRQPARQEDRRRQRVRGAAQPRISAAAAARRSVGDPVRGRRQKARLASVLVAARDPVAALQRPAGLHLLRLLPGVRLPRRRQIVDPGHQAARGRRHRQFQAAHRRHVLSRQQRQRRQGDRRVVLRARTAPTTRSKPTSSSSRRSSTTTRG